jgi:hypothetical protein
MIAAVVVVITALLLSRGTSETARVQNILVVLKVLAIPRSITDTPTIINKKIASTLSTTNIF